MEKKTAQLNKKIRFLGLKAWGDILPERGLKQRPYEIEHNSEDWSQFWLYYYPTMAVNPVMFSLVRCQIHLPRFQEPNWGKRKTKLLLPRR